MMPLQPFLMITDQALQQYCDKEGLMEGSAWRRVVFGVVFTKAILVVFSASQMLGA